jgi:UDP-glucuronate 4-epimerase
VTRIVVTGAAGFIGSHLVDALVARGDVVVGVDNFDPLYPRATKEANLRGARCHPGFSFVEADITDASALRPLLTAETVLVHLAAKAGIRPSFADPVGYARANVVGTAAVVDAARAAGLSRLVLASSSSVYGDVTPAPFREDSAAIQPLSPYAATKRAAELLLASAAGPFGLRIAALRFFTVYGPRQRPDLAIHTFARRMMSGEPITLFGGADTARDYTFVSDAVAGAMAAIDWTAHAPVGMDVFNLGSNRPIPLHEVVRTLSAALKLEPAVTPGPAQPGDVQSTWADLEKSERVLGYRAMVPFETGIARFVVWCEEAYGHQH